MRRTRIKRPRKYRMRTKKKFKMNRYQNCREIDPMIPSNPNELSDIEKCADNIEAIDGASIDETNPSLYYALTEPSRPDINPQCITKQNYINLPIKTEDDRGNPPYFRRNPFTNTPIRCNEVEKLKEPHDYVRRQIYRNEGSMTIYYSTDLKLIFNTYDLLNSLDRISQENENIVMDIIIDNNINLNQNFDLLDKTRPGSNILLPVEKQFKFLTLFQAIILFRQDKLLERIFAEYPHVNILSYHQLFLQDNDEYRYNLPEYLIKSQTYYNILSLLFYNNIPDKNNQDRILKIVKLLKKNLYEEDFEELFESQKIKIEIKTPSEIDESEEKKNYLKKIISGAGNERLQSIITKQRRMNPLTDEETQILNQHERKVAPQKEKLKNIINKYDYKYSQLPLKTIKLRSNNQKIVNMITKMMENRGLSTDFSLDIYDMILLFQPSNYAQSIYSEESKLRTKILSQFIENRINQNTNLDDENEVNKLIISILKNLDISAIKLLISNMLKVSNLVDNGYVPQDFFIKKLQKIGLSKISYLWRVNVGSDFTETLSTDHAVTLNHVLDNSIREVRVGLNEIWAEFPFSGYIEAIIFKIQDIQEDLKKLKVRDEDQPPLSDYEMNLLNKLELFEIEYIEFLIYIIDICELNPAVIIKSNKRVLNVYYTKILTRILMESVTFRNTPKRGFIRKKLLLLKFPKANVTVVNPYTLVEENLFNPYDPEGYNKLVEEFNDFPFDAFTQNQDLLFLALQKLATKENILFKDLKHQTLEIFVSELLPEDAPQIKGKNKSDTKNKLINEIIKYGVSDSKDRTRYSLFLNEGMIETPSDGDCFFHSLSGLIKEHYRQNITIKKLRNMIVLVLKDIIERGIIDPNVALISMQNNVEDRNINTLQDYYKYMNKKGSWATELEIVAATYLLNRQIRLRSERQGIPDRLFPETSSEFYTESPLVLYHVSVGTEELDGNHYQYRKRLDNEPILPLPEYNFIIIDSSSTSSRTSSNTSSRTSSRSDFTIPVSPDYINPQDYSDQIQTFMYNTNEDNEIFVSTPILNKLRIVDLMVLCRLYNLDYTLCNKGKKIDKIRNIKKMLKEKYEKEKIVEETRVGIQNIQLEEPVISTRPSVRESSSTTESSTRQRSTRQRRRPERYGVWEQ